MEKNKRYAWCDDKNFTYYETFDTMEEAVDCARKLFLAKEAPFDDGTHVIIVGEAESFDIDSFTKNYLDNIEDSLFDALGDFAPGCEPDVELDKEFFEKAQKALTPLIEKYSHIHPESTMNSSSYYDLKRDKFISIAEYYKMEE